MRRLLPLLAFTPFVALAASSSAGKAPIPAGEKDTRVYELRVYYAAPGKLDALNARFRDHTVKLFEKHGLTNVGYFVPVGENKDNKLVYWISAPSKDARDKSFKEFAADPDWKKAAAESEKDGKLVDEGRIDIPDRDRLLAGAQDREVEGRSRVRIADLHRDEGQPRRPQRPLQEPHASSSSRSTG